MKISYRVTLDSRDVERVTPENLLEYALGKGWVVMETREVATIITIGDDDVLWLPNMTTLGDYDDRVQDAVQMFCNSEQRDPREILREIVLWAVEHPDG